MSTLSTLAASLNAGQVGVLNERGDGSNYGPNMDNPQFGGETSGSGMQQGSKAQYDPTPWRAYDGYLVNNGAGYSAGASTVALNTGVEPIVPGMILRFKNVSGAYTVTSGIPDGGSGSVTFTPGLSENIADNLEVRIMKRGERIYHFGHSHTAQSNSWPSWTVLEAYDNKWKTLPAYKHFFITNPDQYLEDIAYGNFHQDGGTTFNPASQYFYSGLPSGNPTRIRKIQCGEYNPLSIGKFTDFALTGTLTFTEDSATVTGSGTAFTSELAPGYQIWRDNDEMFGGVSQRIVTVASVESDTSLTLVNNYTGTTGAGSAFAHDSSDLKSHWYWEAGGSQTLAANGAPVLEFWPERDCLVFLDARSNGTIYEKRAGRGDSAAWVTLKDSGDGYDPSDGGTYGAGGLVGHLEYNTKRRKMLVCVGVRIAPHLSDGDDGLRVWEMSIDHSDPQGTVTLTELDNFPFPMYVNSTTGGVVTHDPVSGKYLFIVAPYDEDLEIIPDTPYRFYELNPDASAGNQFTELDGSVFPEDMSSDQEAAFNQCHQLIACVPYNLGVIFLAGKDKTFLYKHTANTWAADGMTSLEKEAGIPGLQGSCPFGDGWEPKYSWSLDQEAADPALAAAVAGLTHAGADANLKIACWSAHENAPRTDNGDGVCIPTLDTNIRYQGEGASLRFPWRNQTGMTTGELLTNIDGTDGTAAHDVMISPTLDARAAKLFFRFPMRVDATMLAPAKEHTSITEFLQSGCTTPSADSPIVDMAVGGADGTWVGKKVYVDWILSQNWRFGFYTVESVQSSTRITLNASPTLPGFAGVNGVLWVEPDEDSELAGTKVAILHGNTPNGSSSSNSIETATVRLQRASNPLNKYMEAYGHTGSQGFPTPGFVGPVEADTWHVFDMEIEFLPTARDFYTTGAGSVILKSDTLTFPEELETFESGIYFDGYGPRSPEVGSSKWVPGLYRVVSVDTINNEITLDSSPTPTAAGTDGVAYFSVGSVGALAPFGKNRVRFWQDGSLILEYNDLRVDFAAFTQPYGYGRLSLSNAANWRDATQVHDDAYTYFGHLLFSTQPIPFEAAVSGPTPPVGKLHKFRFRSS